MITTIIFDIGRVLITYDWTKFLEKDFHDAESVAILRDAFFGHGLWNELDRGVIPEEELIRQLAVYAPGRENQIREFIHTFAAQFEQMPYSKQWIRDLKERGFAVYFLSNYSHQAINANREVLDFIPLMDGGVFSCDVGLIKPEPEIYQLLCSKYGLKMEECVFIDDKQANTDAAKALGMQAITFRGYEEAVRELEEMELRKTVRD